MKSSYFISTFINQSYICFNDISKVTKLAKNIIDNIFDKENKFYFEMDNDSYQSLVLSCQNEINKINFIQEFCKSTYSQIKNIIGDPIFIQSSCNLRATRPTKKNQEFVGYHRETHYGEPFLKYSCNIWIPIKNVKENNSLYYIPMSHHIQDDEIKLKFIPAKESSVKRYSNAHKIGLPYAPKEIIRGIDFNKRERLIVKENQFALFPCDLIHGGAENNSTNIRFSLDFSILNKKYVKEANYKDLQKKQRFFSEIKF